MRISDVAWELVEAALCTRLTNFRDCPTRLESGILCAEPKGTQNNKPTDTTMTESYVQNQIVVSQPNEIVRLDVWLETYELVANCDKSSCLLFKRIADVKGAA